MIFFFKRLSGERYPGGASSGESVCGVAVDLSGGKTCVSFLRFHLICLSGHAEKLDLYIVACLVVDDMIGYAAESHLVFFGLRGQFYERGAEGEYLHLNYIAIVV